MKDKEDKRKDEPQDEVMKDKHSLDLGCNLCDMNNVVLHGKLVQAKEKIKWSKTRLVAVNDDTKQDFRLQTKFKMKEKELRKKTKEHNEKIERVQKALDAKTKQLIEHLKRESNDLKEKG